MIMAITGTSRGIGYDLAQHYLSKGCFVAGCSRNHCEINHPNYLHSILDVTDPALVRGWVQGIKHSHNRLDVVIANAGKVYANSLMMVTPADAVEKTIRTSLLGTYYTCQEAAKVMVNQKYGRIITLSSMTVANHELGTSAYSAAKAGIEEMTKILAKEIASLDITCNCIAPSLYAGTSSSVFRMGKEMQERALHNTVIQRMLGLTELTNVIDMFIENGAVTGQVVYLGVVD